MSPSRPKQPRAYQITIDDLDPGWEHIPGAMPADPVLLEQERARAYNAFAAGFTGSCIPDQKIHVFRDTEERCICTAKKEDK